MRLPSILRPTLSMLPNRVVVRYLRATQSIDLSKLHKINGLRILRFFSCETFGQETAKEQQKRNSVLTSVLSLNFTSLEEAILGCNIFYILLQAIFLQELLMLHW